MATRKSNPSEFGPLSVFRGPGTSTKTDLTRPEPPPTRGRKEIGELVIQDMRTRIELGQRKYGTKLMSFNGRNALRDAYEEALDLCMYLRQAMEEADSA